MNFKHSLLSLLDKEYPVAKLANIPFWHQRSNQCEYDLDQANCYITNNYFYGFYTSAPIEEFLESAESNGRKAHADYIFIPNIRDVEDTRVLSNNNYFRVPAATESIVVIRNSLEEIFSTTSRRYFKGNMRYKRIADTYYVTDTYLNDDIDAKVLQIVSDLHEQHSIRHDNSINIFNCDVLKQMLLHRESSNLRILIKKNKETKNVVQAIILIEYPFEKKIHYQSQAIRHDLVPKNHNLYRSSFIDVYLHAMCNGYIHVNLGRGLTSYKQKHLAASIFYEQSHWLKKL